jgi:tRNA threonylcarbamoyladenosine biosynthesis protein TsaE
LLTLHKVDIMAQNCACPAKEIRTVEGNTLAVISDSPAETAEIGEAIGKLLAGREVLCLEGELGSGKTTLTQAIGRALGVKEPITSPTFTLVNEYRGRGVTLYHVDLYRLHATEEIVQAGIDSYFHSHGLCLVEWAEKARAILPREHLYITLEHAGKDRRQISLRAKGAPYRKMLERLKETIGS